MVESTAKPDRMVSIRVSALFRYPIKSTRADPLDTARLDAFGIEGDRRWALSGPNGEAITQREAPRLATVRAHLVASGLAVEAPGRRTLEVATPRSSAPRVSIRIWKDRTTARLASPEAGAWFSEFLSTECRLVYMSNEVFRPVDPRYGRSGDRVGLADGFPLLLVSESSLAELSGWVGIPVPVDRFRANLVVSGAEPFEEDGWGEIRVGSSVFRAVKPCGRCVVTTVDQRTGERGEEPLRTLARRRKRNGKALFGQNLVHDGPGILRVGDEMEVLSRRARD